ncbi:MAG TPA: amino acid adenylation domain-containing protein, partial [Longimicrobium sp.]|nr:amino acid adenylation domain-containing protein [Longimicrobium sp.]
EALRTTFAQVDGAPEQRIAPAEASRFHLVQHDLRGRADAEAELGRLMAGEARAPFDLERGPLIRGRLIRLAEADHVLLLTMHHIVSDGWSMGVLTRELGALYGAFRRGEPDPLPGLAVQYADFAAWQRRWVEGDVLREQAEYWTRTLAGAPELLALPTDRPRPAETDHAGAVFRLELDEELTAGLKALSRRHGTTLYMTLLAAWAAVLGRLSGQDDVVIGTPTAGRGRREIEGLIGFFVNTLAVRVDLSGAPTVAELLGRVKERTLGAQHHQDIPFEQVVERVAPARSLSHTPLFQVMFAWQSTPTGAGALLPGLDVGGVGAGPTEVRAKFDLSLTMREADGRIRGGVEYATALFEPETVERYAGYLRAVLGAMAAAEEQRVDGIGLLSRAERRRVLEEWNATGAAYPAGTCVHERFQEQVERAPGATAVVSGEDRLTYAELNARANRLAHYLRGLGVGPDARVALCAERGPEMVVGLLAILKAGGAYVPLDPGHPQERLEYMLRDSAPLAVLTQARIRGRVEGAGVPVLCLDGDAGRWAAEADRNPERGELGPEHLAYVIYTSGSTGAPKGVMIEHRHVCHQVSALQDAFGLTERDRNLQFASVTFDASVEEIFGALLTGAALVLRDDGWLAGPGAFWSRCREHGVTVVSLPTRFWQLLVDEPAATVPACVRLVVIGGEAVDASSLAAWFRREGHRPRLLNTYGPTETTVNATLREVADDPARWRSIGRPLANTRVYVLDGARGPVPVGVAGELYVGGAGVARGYLDRPELTAERFVEDPFAGEPGARMYRTGDLGRWLPDGTVEFLGRNDFQVKIRGFRVELGEIEARLVDHPGVREAVVLARQDAPGEQRLVAYYAGEQTPDADALRAHLLERLPDYMVPAAYVRLERLPVTPSGKLDRQALPAPADGAYARRGYEAPEGQTEQALAEIWAAVLGVERVGRQDSFFELGGHSLLAVQVISRVRQVLEVEVPLRTVFERPRLSQLAQHVLAAQLAQFDPLQIAHLAELVRASAGDAAACP